MIYVIDLTRWIGAQYANANTSEFPWTAPHQIFTERWHPTSPGHSRLVIQDGRDPVADIDRGRPT